MPAVPPTPRVKLRSSSRRVPRQRAGAGGAVLEAEPEPEMRLSRAILVMLLLHIVAIGGFAAFSLIKERNPAPAPAGGVVEAEDSQLSAAPGGKTTARKPDADAQRPNVHVVRPGETLTQIANATGVSPQALAAANAPTNLSNGLHTGQELKLPAPGAGPRATPKPTGAAADALALIEGPAADGGHNSPHLPADSGRTYIVGKGDTPISIAHKLKVSQDALLKLNQIDDPKKLKPGQKLRVPVATPPKIVARH